MDLNNHEIVLLALSLIFLAWVISKGDLRTSLTLVIKALFAPKIIGILGAATIYIAGCTYLLSIVEIWNLDNLKTTIVWAISTAFVAMFNISKVEKEKEFFQKMIFEGLALSALITFLAELYNLSIVTEIILIPILSLLALLSAVASTQKEAKILRVKKMIDGILLLSGIMLVSFRLYEVFSNHSKYFTISNAREFLVPVDLTIGFIPFLFILNLFVKFEMIWFSLTFKVTSRKLRFFAFYRALRSFKFDLDAWNRWRRFVLVSEIDNKNEVLSSIHHIKLIKRREKSPNPVYHSEGWSPYQANGYLSIFNLVTRDYHLSHDGMWFASAGPVELDISSDILKSNVSYFLEGNETVVKKLQLSLNIYNPREADHAQQKFLEITKTLFAKALGKEGPTAFNMLTLTPGFALKIDHKEIFVERFNWQGSIKNGYTLNIFIISK